MGWVKLCFWVHFVFEIIQQTGHVTIKSSKWLKVWTFIIMIVSCPVQWNLSWETMDMRDHLSWKTAYIWKKELHFNNTEPVTRDHLSWQTIFLWPMGQSFKTGSTVFYKKTSTYIILIHPDIPIHRSGLWSTFVRTEESCHGTGWGAAGDIPGSGLCQDQPQHPLYLHPIQSCCTDRRVCSCCSWWLWSWYVICCTVVPLLKDTLERTPLYKGHKFLAASTVNACGAPSHQRTPL